MNSIYTTRPSIDVPLWNFRPWDSILDTDPPCKFRGLMFANGSGNYLIMRWRYCLCETGCCDLVAGTVYRVENFDEALRLYQSIDFDEFECGVYLFCGRTVLCRKGEEFPEPLPNGRW